MQTITSSSGLRSMAGQWRKTGESLALVPTMGNLHAGHLSLVDQARRVADHTVVSLFVNPTQFVAGEDYDTYPRTQIEDSMLLSEKGVDALFVPGVSEMYPFGLDEQTRVEVPALDNMLCGEFRPGHFSGVATVVTKLLNLVQPDIAIFGDKDYQQLLVIRRIVAELCIPVDIKSGPTVREPDGLALSSRNSYLTPDERKKAPLLFKTLERAADRLVRDGVSFSTAEAESVEMLKLAGFRPEYFSVRKADNLSEPNQDDTDLVILVAAWLGETRLIDHVATHKMPLNDQK